MRWVFSKNGKSRWPAGLAEFTLIPGSGEAQPAPWPDRHSSPNLAAQLRQSKIDLVICSALDSEPGLRLNAAVAARRAEAVAKGIGELLGRTGAKRACIVVESRAPREWINPIRAAAGGAAIVQLPNDYPQSDPAMLLRTVARRELKPGELPSDHGILLIDAAGAATVGGLSLIPLGILDHATGQAFYLEAAPGMTLAAVLAAAGIQSKLRVTRAGDLLRQRAAVLDQPVGAGEVCLHLLTPVEPAEVEACIRCGWCADVCPTRVKPAWVLEAAQRGDTRLARSGRAEACIECGLCDEVCPAHLPLLGAIRGFKSNDQLSKSMPA